MLSENHLAIQDDHHFVLRWNDYQVVSLTLNELNFLDVIREKFLLVYPSEEGEHIEVFGQEGVAFCIGQFRLGVGEPAQVVSHTLIE